MTLAALMLFMTSTHVFASSADIDRSDLEQAFRSIVEYSDYDYQTGTWILDHSIVEDGVFTENQYNNAEKAGQLWYQYAEENNNGQRALPAALVLVLKAIGAIAGTAIVTRIVDEIYTFGMSTACKNFQSISLFKDYCKANGYL